MSVNNNQVKIFPLSLGFPNCYLITSSRGTILVDAGQKEKLDQFLKLLNKHHININAIDLIIITHCHYDHVGSLADIQYFSQAKVLIQRAESDPLQKGISIMPKGVGWFGKLVSFLGNIGFKQSMGFKAVQPDLVYAKQYALSDWGIDGEVLHTPGHTAGSSTIVVGEHAFVGDTCFNIWPGSIYPFFCNYPDELLDSWQILINTGCRYFYPGHGRPIKRPTLIGHYRKLTAERN